MDEIFKNHGTIIRCATYVNKSKEEKEEKLQETKGIFEIITAVLHFEKLMTDIKPKTQEIWQTPSRIITQKYLFLGTLYLNCRKSKTKKFERS